MAILFSFYVDFLQTYLKANLQLCCEICSTCFYVYYWYQTCYYICMSWSYNDSILCLFTSLRNRQSKWANAPVIALLSCYTLYLCLFPILSLHRLLCCHFCIIRILIYWIVALVKIINSDIIILKFLIDHGLLLDEDNRSSQSAYHRWLVSENRLHVLGLLLSIFIYIQITFQNFMRVCVSKWGWFWNDIVKRFWVMKPLSCQSRPLIRNIVNQGMCTSGSRLGGGSIVYKT